MSQIPGNNLFFLLDHPELLNNKNCKKFFSDFFNDMENMKDLEKTKSPINEKLTTVQTKYGELVISLSDVVTYAGNHIWSVSHE